MPKGRPRKKKVEFEILYVDIVLNDPHRTTYRVDYRNDRVFEMKMITLDIIPSIGGPITLADFTKTLREAKYARSQGDVHRTGHPDSLSHEEKE